MSVLRSHAIFQADEPISGSRTAQLFKEIDMNKDQVKGAAKDAAGKAQKNVGDAVGSTEHQAKGLVKQAEGKVQKAYGDAKEVLKGKK